MFLLLPWKFPLCSPYPHSYSVPENCSLLQFLETTPGSVASFSVLNPSFSLNSDFLFNISLLTYFLTSMRDTLPSDQFFFNILSPSPWRWRPQTVFFPSQFLSSWGNLKRRRWERAAKCLTTVESDLDTPSCDKPPGKSWTLVRGIISLHLISLSLNPFKVLEAYETGLINEILSFWGRH